MLLRSVAWQPHGSKSALYSMRLPRRAPAHSFSAPRNDIDFYRITKKKRHELLHAASKYHQEEKLQAFQKFKHRIPISL